MLCLLWMTASAAAQDNLPPKQASPFDVKQIHSGHSLTDPLFYPHWPGQYVNLMNHVLGYWAEDLIGKSTIPGSPLGWRWDNPPCCGAPDARHDIDDWEVLCITERVPLLYEGGSTQSWYIQGIQEQRENLSLFVNNAWQNGNAGAGTPTLLWTTWTNIDDSDGPWRDMLDILGEEWENMQDYANDHKPALAPPVYLIPGHKMMARLYDDIAEGLVPGISDISEFFSDNIHTNEYGAYAIAMIHYACLFNTSPVGLPHNLLPGADPGVAVPSPALATYLQEMIWEEVTAYPRTGIYVSLNADLKDFRAQRMNEQVKLTFELGETDLLDSIEIQHGGRDQQYKPISKWKVTDNQSQHHQEIHDNPVLGENYYRLRMISKDGTAMHSPIQMVRFDGRDWRIYPNPATHRIQLEGLSHNARVRLMDLQGRVLEERKQATEMAVGHLAPGLYILEVTDGQQSGVEKVVVER